jgi:hypothetical protein
MAPSVIVPALVPASGYARFARTGGDGHDSGMHHRVAHVGAALASAALVAAALGACGGSGSGSSATGRPTTSADTGLTVATATSTIQVVQGIGTVRTETGSTAGLSLIVKTVAPTATVPAKWQPTMRELAVVQRCLRNNGILAGGSPFPEFETHPNSPVGTLLIGQREPTTISIYRSASKAHRVYDRYRGSNGTMIQLGALLITSTATPPSNMIASERRCAAHP